MIWILMGRGQCGNFVHSVWTSKELADNKKLGLTGYGSDSGVTFWVAGPHTPDSEK